MDNTPDVYRPSVGLVSVCSNYFHDKIQRLVRLPWPLKSKYVREDLGGIAKEQYGQFLAQFARNLFEYSDLAFGKEVRKRMRARNG